MEGSRLRFRALSVLFAAGIVLAPLARAEVQPVPELRFGEPVFIDTERHGGEPVSVVADDGSIVVSAHRGTTHLLLTAPPEVDWYAVYQNQVYLWRSTDGGSTWSRIEAVDGVSMHTVGSNGFSDPDLTKDAAGRLYGAELGVTNVSVFASGDHGATWPDATPFAQYGFRDRPWVAGRGPGQVYLSWSGGLAKSEDGGRTFLPRKTAGGLNKVFIDPADRQGLYVHTGYNTLGVSRDDGSTWRRFPLGQYWDGAAIQSLGVDAEGWVYMAGPHGGAMRFVAFDPHAETWTQPVTIPKPGSGTPLFPWVIAGDAGRAAVAWYEATVVGPAGVEGFDRALGTFEIRVYVSVTQRAREGWGFSTADAVGRPIHVGRYPCTGLGCNAFAFLGDRRLGDFFTINHDLEGRVFVTTGDTTIAGPGGLPYQTSRPLFVKADDASPRLLAR